MSWTQRSPPLIGEPVNVFEQQHLDHEESLPFWL